MGNFLQAAVEVAFMEPTEVGGGGLGGLGGGLRQPWTNARGHRCLGSIKGKKEHRRGIWGLLKCKWMRDDRSRSSRG